MSAGDAIEAAGEAALLARLRGAEPSADLTRRVRAVLEALDGLALDGVRDVVPAPGSVLVRFDPTVVTAESVRSEMARVIASTAARDAAGTAAGTVHHTVEVTYDGADLDEVSRMLDLPVDALVRAHAACEYTVLATGFAPGFVYLGPLPENLRLPRRDEPRLRVPGGSVAIAGAQSGIYGTPGPGGWWLLGRTATPTFDPAASPPTPFAIGDTVSFRAA